MQVTIGIFVHNIVKGLKHTLNSLYANTQISFKLVIVDDASDDTTRAFLKSLSGISLITNINRMGYAHCANLVIENSNTPYIVFLESASYVTKGWLNLLLKTLNNNTKLGIAGPSTNMAWGAQGIVSFKEMTTSEIDRTGNKLRKKWKDKYQFMNELHNISGFCYVFKREIVDKIGYFDEKYGLGQCEEIDFSTRAFHVGYDAVWVCGSYVHRYPQERFGENWMTLLEKNKKIYQDKFCHLKITNQRKGYCHGCEGGKCMYFRKPRELNNVHRFPHSFTIKEIEEISLSNRENGFEEFPLVSCIMPTADRDVFIPKAVEYFLRQDYPNKN